MHEQASGPEQTLLAQAWRQLLAVHDPELPVSVVRLGLIRGLQVEDGVAHVQLTYTSMGCPWTDWIRNDIHQALLEVEGIDEVRLEEVWSPVWTRADASREARE